MCRDGLWQLQLMLEGIMNGQSGADDLDVMKETLVAMKTVGCPNTQKVAKLTKDQVREIATIKMPDLNAASVEAAMSMVAGTARSMGITVED